MKLFVTGAAGGLGRAFLAQVPGHHDVEAFSHQELDIGDYHAVMQTVLPLHPDAVLNFAAMTRVDDCETDGETAYRANTTGPQNLALAARRAGAVLLHVSTDYVFDGEKAEPYDELDVPHPISVYARSKLGGEVAVRHLHPEHFVVRTGYVFGSGSDYISGAVERLSRGDAAGALTDRTGTPTYVGHLAAQILPLVLTGRFGTYHVAGSDLATWHDVLSRLKDMAGLTGEVTGQRAEDLGLPARRPRNSALRSLFTAELGLSPMPSLDVALKEFADARGL
jgi:dTDP-4-dehydrorhamnose reductase